MKRILIYNIVLILSLVVTGCNDFLIDTEVLNTEDKESGFYTKEHADQTITAIYANFRQRGGLNGREPHVLFDIASADLKVTRESNSVNNYSFNGSSDDEAFGSHWREMYSIIGRCNVSMELVPQTEASDALKSRYHSEAIVLRAIAYYHLMMAYNTVPLTLEPIDPGDKPDLIIGDSTREEIYAALIADLEGAISNDDFPWEKDMSGSDKGHIGQATARTILTYVYLSRGWENDENQDFEKAKQYAKEVIDLGAYSLEPVLLDAYYKWFSSESIFELPSTSEAEGMGNQVVPWFVPLTNPPNEEKDQYNGWFKMMSTQALYDKIEEGDARRHLLANPVHGENTFWAPKFLGGDKYGGHLEIIDEIYDNDLGLPTYQCAKGTGSPESWVNRLGPYETNSTWVVYRLSDVYLLYAEACIKTGNEGEALTYINLVRKRARNAFEAHLGAGHPDIPTHIPGVPADLSGSVSGPALLDALKLERRVELFAEMKRIIDLRRWSLGGASDLEDDVNISGTWASKYKWFPKPQDQIDLSEDNIKQNPGY